MKEESLKKIIQKSTLETSDDFINNLMSAIEVEQKQKVTIWDSFKFSLSISILLIVIATGVLFKILHQENATFLNENIPTTPIFIGITAILFYAINFLIRLQENSKIKM